MRLEPGDFVLSHMSVWSFGIQGYLSGLIFESGDVLVWSDYEREAEISVLVCELLVR